MHPITALHTLLICVDNCHFRALGQMIDFPFPNRIAKHQVRVPATALICSSKDLWVVLLEHLTNLDPFLEPIGLLGGVREPREVRIARLQVNERKGKRI
jgi:hypothetical protein